MKKLLSAILVLALVSTVVPASFAEPHQVMQGTQVHLTLLNAISTSASRDGDPFVAIVAEPVLLDFLWRPTLPDPDDDMVLETGVNGRADAIVTFNRRHFVAVKKQFGLDVLSPADAIERLEKRS